MEFSTSQLSDQLGSAAGPLPHPLLQENWGTVLSCLPADLDRSAREQQALRRRRGIRQAADLLRLVFCYGLLDWSFRQIGLWATLLVV